MEGSRSADGDVGGEGSAQHARHADHRRIDVVLDALPQPLPIDLGLHRIRIMCQSTFLTFHLGWGRPIRVLVDERGAPLRRTASPSMEEFHAQDPSRPEAGLPAIGPGLQGHRQRWPHG